MSRASAVAVDGGPLGTGLASLVPSQTSQQTRYCRPRFESMLMHVVAMYRKGAEQIMAMIDERYRDPALTSLDHAGPDLAAAVLGTACLPATADHVPVARRFTRSVLTLACLADDPTDTGELIVCELMTNVVLHNDWDLQPFVVIALVRIGPMLRIEIFDSDPSMGPRRRAGMDSEHGRGLDLVEALSERWGIAGTRWGKCVWAELLGWPDLPTEPGP